MSMPPQGPGGPPNNNASGSGGPPQSGWDQNGWNQSQGGPQGGQGGWDQSQGGGDQNQHWDQNQGQHDPYQQQYEAYSQPEQDYQTEAFQAPYDQSLSTASMPAAQSNPAGSGWHEPRRSGNHKLPWIVSAAIIVVGAVVAVLILVNSNDDDKSAGGNGNESGQSQTDGGDSDSSDASDPSTDSDKSDSPESASDPSTEADDPTGAGRSDGSDGGGTLPAAFPVPASVTIDEGGTYCSGNSCFGGFEADDPVAAYEDWVAELEAAGYTITTQEITGTGSDAIWAIEATGELEIIMYWAGTGVLTST